MPGIDGFTLMNRLRGTFGDRKPAAIALSAYARAEDQAIQDIRSQAVDAAVAAAELLIAARPTAANLAWGVERVRAAALAAPVDERADAARARSAAPAEVAT